MGENGPNNDYRLVFTPVDPFNSDLDIKNIDVEKRENYQNNQEGIKEINVIRPSKLGFSRNENKTSFSLKAF